MRKCMKTQRKSKKTLKNKISHRMRRGGVPPAPAPQSNPQSNPILYGIVVNLEGRLHVESFNLMPNTGGIPYYTSSQNPDMIIQVSFSPYRMVDAAEMTPPPVAKIEYDISLHVNPNANLNARLSEIKYLYSSLDDANTTLRQLMDPIAVLARLHPNESVSNRAKTYLKPSTSFTSQQRIDALARGMNKVLLHSLMKRMPNPKFKFMNKTQISMLRPSQPNGGSRRHKRK